MPAVSLSGEFNTQQFTDGGVLAALYRLYTYEPGTTTHKIAYTDDAGSVSHTYVSDGLGGQYIALNARGELPAPIFLQSGGYDLTLKTPAGATVWTRRARGISDPAAVVLASLIDSTDVALGDALVAVKNPASGGLARTQHQKNLDFVHLADFIGADPTGASSSTGALEAALAAHKHVDCRNGAWRFDTTIDIPGNDRVIDFSGATINANVGSNALISFAGAKSGLTIRGGLWEGTADVWLSLVSSDTTPAVEADYARQIRIEGVHVTSATILRAIDMTNAVRKVFIDDSVFFTVSGINASGKCVEIFADKTIIYSATGAAGSYGVKLRSPAGAYYSEGWHFTDCLVDAFEKSFDVNDVFVLTYTGGYAGAASGGDAFYFGQPTSDKCDHITLSGFTCVGKIRFAPTAGRLYHASISGLSMTGISGVHIQAGNNAAAIRLSNIKGESSTGGLLFEGIDNNANIVIDGFDCDSTFVGGVQLKGTAGDDCSVSNPSYDGSGDVVYVERPVLLKNIPVTTANVAALKRVFNSGNLAGNVTVGNNIASLTSQRFAKGETGEIVVELSLSGMNAGTQRLDITTPAGMVVPTATGSTMASIEPGVAAQRLSVRIPYYMTADAEAVTLSISNAAGSTVTVGAHSFFGYVKDH
jgi:hypothetical protein